MQHDMILSYEQAVDTPQCMMHAYAYAYDLHLCMLHALVDFKYEPSTIHTFQSVHSTLRKSCAVVAQNRHHSMSVIL
jgi:hypothetical protein